MNHTVPQRRESLVVSRLEGLRAALCDTPELRAKRDITLAAGVVTDGASTDDLPVYARPYARPGDDCAAIPLGEGYQLLAIEGMLPAFVEQDPWHAGWSSVMVNVSDIAAMGGRANAVVNAYWHHDTAQARELLRGIQHACEMFGIPLAGGHSSIAPNYHANLAVAVTGYATRLLSCWHVAAGQALYLAVDLRGEWHGDNPFWGIMRNKSRAEVRALWELPAQLAEAGRVSAAKDISNGGVLGSLIMMLELNRLGAEVEVAAIPRPPQEKYLLRWLRAFQSYGFLFTGAAEQASVIEQSFAAQGVACRRIGTITETPRVMFSLDDERLEFWNLAEQDLTGFGQSNRYAL